MANQNYQIMGDAANQKRKYIVGVGICQRSLMYSVPKVS